MDSISNARLTADEIQAAIEAGVAVALERLGILDEQAGGDGEQGGSKFFGCIPPDQQRAVADRIGRALRGGTAPVACAGR